jgi:hypothetical protein
MITGSCRGLFAKPSPYLLPQAWAHKSNRRGAAAALAALGAGDWSGLELGRLGKKEEENEGTKMECSPWAESDRRIARGGAQQRPAAVSRDGGAPVLNWRR